MVAEAVILAGGLGTRLRQAVNDVPKPMAPIAGHPFLAYLLRHLEQNGVRRIVLAVGYRHEAIQDFFGSVYGALHLDYSVEHELLGTGGGLRQALSYTEGKYAFVVNGDTFLRLDYPTMAAVLPGDDSVEMILALRRISDASRYGRAVLSNDRIQAFTTDGTSGPGLINAGSYLVRRDLFERYPMPPKFSLERDFLEARVSEIRPVAFPCEAAFIDIGIPEAFEEAQALIPAWVPA
jgi:D-glycero-alpha-D-manno-heptose 1-phosphate guanylyltransferase